MDHAPAPILVVEDDVDIREVLCEVLLGAGYEVQSAMHGADALDQLRTSPSPCLILLDLHMPVMDGWMFCEEVARSQTFSAIPIIILSAVSGMNAARDPQGHIASRLRKPIDVDDLLDVVAAHC